MYHWTTRITKTTSITWTTCDPSSSIEEDRLLQAAFVKISYIEKIKIADNNLTNSYILVCLL